MPFSTRRLKIIAMQAAKTGDFPSLPRRHIRQRMHGIADKGEKAIRQAHHWPRRCPATFGPDHSSPAGLPSQDIDLYAVDQRTCKIGK